MQPATEKPKRTGTAPATIARKKARGLCLYPFCGAEKADRKKYCHKHHQREFKRKKFIQYVYNARKQKATARGIFWGLSLEEFAGICEASGYPDTRKFSGKKLSLDRVNPELGYIKENIRVISVSENSRKGYYERGDKETPPKYRPENIFKEFMELEEAPF